MMDLEAVTRKATAKTFKLIEASPESLRECADRMELALKGALYGECVMCELSPSVQVVCKNVNAFQGVNPQIAALHVDEPRTDFTN